jgi:hypothetical protein
MVWNKKPKGAIHLFNGSNLSIVRGEGLHQVFRGMNVPGIHYVHLWEHLQLGKNHFKKLEQQHIVGLDTKGWRNACFSHGIVPTRCNMHKECLHNHGSKLECF